MVNAAGVARLTGWAEKVAVAQEQYRVAPQALRNSARTHQQEEESGVHRVNNVW